MRLELLESVCLLLLLLLSESHGHQGYSHELEDTSYWCGQCRDKYDTCIFLLLLWFFLPMVVFLQSFDLTHVSEQNSVYWAEQESIRRYLQKKG